MQRQHNNIAAPSFADSSHARILRDLAVAALIVLPCLAAQAAAGAGTDDLAGTTCGFVQTIVKVLNGLSIVVVTIAVIFSGYQIAFAHKRIGDVAPVFIGALLIGAATQIAKVFLSGSSGTDACSPTGSITVDPLTQLASIVHSLAHYA